MYEMKEYAYDENRSEKQKSSPEHKKSVRRACKIIRIRIVEGVLLEGEFQRRSYQIRHNGH